MTDSVENSSIPTLCVENFATFNHLRETNQLCDVSINVGGRKLNAHKVILSVRSPFFHRMFTVAMMEADKREVSLPDITYETMEQIIQYIYTGKMSISPETGQDLLIAANFLQIDSLVDLCGKYVVKQVDAINCFSMKELLKRTNCDKFVARTDNYIHTHFHEIYQNESFLQLDINEVVELLSSTEICYVSEEDVVHGAIRWLNVTSCRKRYAQQIFNCIRLPLLTKAFKAEYIVDNPLFKNFSQVQSFSISAIPRTLKTSILALSKANQNSLQIYDSSAKNWQKLVDIGAKRYKLIAADRKYIYFAGPDGNDYTTFFFDIYSLTTELWTSLPSLPCHAENNRPIAMLVLDSILYVFKMKTWSQELYTVYVTISDRNLIYWVDGGEIVVNSARVQFAIFDQHIHLFETFPHRDTVIHRFDTETREWKRVTNGWNRGSCFMMTTYKGKVYFSGNVNDRKTFNEYNPISNEWKELSPLLHSDTQKLVATTDGIYALCNNLIYFYDVDNDEWKLEGSLSQSLRLSLFTAVPNINCQ